MKTFNCYLTNRNYIILNKLSNYYCLSKSTILTYGIARFNNVRKLNDRNYDETDPFFVNENNDTLLKIKNTNYSREVRTTFCLNSEIKNLLSYLSNIFQCNKSKLVNYVISNILIEVYYNFNNCPLGFRLSHVKEKNSDKFRMGRYQVSRSSIL